MTVDSLPVDVTINQRGALATAVFIEEVDRCVGRHHLFKRSALLIKAFLRFESPNYASSHQSILDSKRGMLSTYALNVMVVYIFNMDPKLAHPLEVLRAFLNTFAHWDWDSSVLTIDGPVAISSGRGTSSQRRSSSSSSSSSAAAADAQSADQKGQGADTLNRFSKLVQLVGEAATGMSTGGHGAFPTRACNIQDPLDCSNNLGYPLSRGSVAIMCDALAKAHHRVEGILRGSMAAVPQNSARPPRPRVTLRTMLPELTSRYIDGFAPLGSERQAETPTNTAASAGTEDSACDSWLEGDVEAMWMALLSEVPDAPQGEIAPLTPHHPPSTTGGLGSAFQSMDMGRVPDRRRVRGCSTDDSSTEESPPPNGRSSPDRDAASDLSDLLSVSSSATTTTTASAYSSAASVSGKGGAVFQSVSVPQASQDQDQGQGQAVALEKVQPPVACRLNEDLGDAAPQAAVHAILTSAMTSPSSSSTTSGSSPSLRGGLAGLLGTGASPGTGSGEGHDHGHGHGHGGHISLNTSPNSEITDVDEGSTSTPLRPSPTKFFPPVPEEVGLYARSSPRASVATELEQEAVAVAATAAASAASAPAAAAAAETTSLQPSAPDSDSATPLLSTKPSKAKRKNKKNKNRGATATSAATAAAAVDEAGSTHLEGTLGKRALKGGRAVRFIVVGTAVAVLALALAVWLCQSGAGLVFLDRGPPSPTAEEAKLPVVSLPLPRSLSEWPAEALTRACSSRFGPMDVQADGRIRLPLLPTTPSASAAHASGPTSSQAVHWMLAGVSTVVSPPMLSTVPDALSLASSACAYVDVISATDTGTDSDTHTDGGSSSSDFGSTRMPQALPTLVYRWVRDGTVVQESLDGILLIANLEKTDLSGTGTAGAAGLYSCLAVYTDARAGLTREALLFQTRLRLAVPPSSPTKGKYFSIKLGSELKLTVEARGVPAPRLQWHRNGFPLTGHTSATISQSAITRADGGTYTLVMTNLAGTYTWTEATVAVVA